MIRSSMRTHLDRNPILMMTRLALGFEIVIESVADEEVHVLLFESAGR